MTSNVGAQELQDQRFAGFGGADDGQDYESIRKTDDFFKFIFR
jgi:ATP-dependent Clp protease ATP-binding subunit ClpC